MGLDKFGKLTKRQQLKSAFQVALAGASLLSPHADAADKLPAGVNAANKMASESVHRRAASVEKSHARMEDLAENIQLVEAKLGPGGEWASLLEDPTTSPEKAHQILRFINEVQAHINVMQVMPEAFKNQPTAFERIAPRRELFHGSTTRKFISIGASGEELESFCNGYHVATGGARFFVTAEHCVQGTTEEHLFEKNGNRRDVAVQYLPDDTGPAMQLDTKTDRDYQGRMAVLRATDRFGKDFLRSSFLIKMSPALQQKIFNGGKTTGFDMTGQFMLLAEPGDATRMSDGMIPVQGVSGARIAVWTDGGYRAFGPQSSATIYAGDAQVPPEQQVGLKSPMFFAEGVDALTELCERARQRHEKPKRPPEEASGFLQRIEN